MQGALENAHESFYICTHRIPSALGNQYCLTDPDLQQRRASIYCTGYHYHPPFNIV